MSEVVYRTTARGLTPMMFALSLFMLLRGHNEPGGGFIGGLLAVSAFALYALAYDVSRARALLRFSPRLILSVGLLMALASGCISWLFGGPFMEGIWIDYNFPGELKLGTVLIFDIGVFLVVIGSALMILFALAEE